MRELHDRVAEQVSRVVVGQHEVVRSLLAAPAKTEDEALALGQALAAASAREE